MSSDVFYLIIFLGQQTDFVNECAVGQFKIKLIIKMLYDIYRILVI